MADVTIKYKDSVIAQMNDAGTKTLKTSGCYCEGDVTVTYAPSSSGGAEANYRMYEITFDTKQPGWVFLTELDDLVMAHINDPKFTVLFALNEYAYEWYSGCYFTASNTPLGYSGEYPQYGFASRQASETQTIQTFIYYPANNTGTSYSIGGDGIFRVDGNKYYICPRDGWIHGGTYRLIFTW